MNRWQSWARRGRADGMVAGMAALTGCAGIKVIDPNVRSFGTAPPSCRGPSSSSACRPRMRKPTAAAWSLRLSPRCWRLVPQGRRRGLQHPGPRAALCGADRPLGNLGRATGRGSGPAFGPRPLMFNWRWTSSWDSASNLWRWRWSSGTASRTRWSTNPVRSSMCGSTTTATGRRCSRRCWPISPQGKPDVHPVQVTLPPQP